MKSLLFLIAMIVSTNAFADETKKISTTVNGVEIWFTVTNEEDKTVSVGYTDSLAIDKETEGSVEIPSTVEGYRITAIGRNAFKDCHRVKSITIPDGVVAIGDYAFYGCQSLGGFKFPECLRIIGNHAFENNFALESVAFPADLYFIGSSAFQFCKHLKKVVLPNSLMGIGEMAFNQCGNLEIIESHIIEPFEIDMTVFGEWYLGEVDPLTDTRCLLGGIGTFFNNCTLYVPLESMGLYKNLHVWNQFAKIEEQYTPTSIEVSTFYIYSPTYDLQGRRMAEGRPLRSGIYVRDGRKFVVK